MTIEILISSVNKKSIEELILPEKNMNIKILVINQTDNNDIMEKDNVKIMNFNEIGLAKSRNRAIKNSSSDICIITDDDVKFKSEIFKEIDNIFEKYPNIDIFTFKYDKHNKSLSKKYKEDSFIHNKFSISKVSSIEIAFRRQSIIQNNIKFDENFGLNSRYLSGEENIFLKDSLDKGLKIMYYPLVIAEHPNETSTSTWSDKKIFSKGALLYRLYGNLAYILIFAFGLKKYNEYKNNYNVFKFVKLMFKGLKDYKNIEK